MRDESALRRDLASLGLQRYAPGELLAAGRRCKVTRLSGAGSPDLVVKQFTPVSVVRHARHHPVPLARFEFQRSGELRSSPDLAYCVARPIAWSTVDGRHLFVQERARGVLLRDFATTASAEERLAVVLELERIVRRAHAAGFFDLDLHTRNVMVRRDSNRELRLTLFDFSRIPYHERPPNRLAAWLVRAGLISPPDRDHRLMRRLRRALRSPRTRPQHDGGYYLP